jgi:hexosaminidase
MNVIPAPQSVEFHGGKGLRLTEGNMRGVDIAFHTDGRADDGSYTLKVHSRGVEIYSGGRSGALYALTTLRHLLPPDWRGFDHLSYLEGTVAGNSAVSKPRRVVIPAMTVEDWPQHSWRGLHLDVSRHFFDKEEVKNYLDVMASYKMNKFHWHLTDDEGWRVEIKKYPLLTEEGAWRTFNNHDRTLLRQAEAEDNPDKLLPEKHLREVDGQILYGGYFTQEDIREIVEYAAVRGIDIMPEVDIPGHSLMAINSYPFLTCFGEGAWGSVFSSPVCPGKDTTLEFFRNIYSEIFDLFPYEFVHLGADEVEMDNWKKCPDCQRRIREHNLANETELQSWFVAEMEKFFIENGRRLVGWDEIADGPLSETAVLMWWRNWAPRNLRKAVENGNDIILCPNTEFYLDYAQGKTDMSRIFNFFTPFSARFGFSDEQMKRILGAQGNLWTEWIPTWARLGYQAYPRALAIAEIVWTAPENRTEEDFMRRVVANFARLDALGMNYKLPPIEGYFETNAFIESIDVAINYPLSNVNVRYTTDGSTPGPDSPEFISPMRLTETTDLTLRLFRQPGNRPDDITRFRFVSSRYADPVAAPAELQSGLMLVRHDVRVNTVADIEKGPLTGTYIIDGIAIPRGMRGNIGLIFDGYISVPEDGIYTFWLNSDDGSTLTIGGQLVIDNDGPHAPRERIGQIALRKGLHTVHARYFDYNGGILQMGTIDADGQRILLEDKGWFHHNPARR